MSKENKKSLRHLNESYIHQIHVLKAICGAAITGGKSKPFDISEVAEMSGLKDDKETLRYLYILEGHKLVTPFPIGDFTSKTWQVTEEGVKAWKQISSELDLAA